MQAKRQLQKRFDIPGKESFDIEHSLLLFTNNEPTSEDAFDQFQLLWLAGLNRCDMLFASLLVENSLYFKWLVEKGADVNWVDRDGDSSVIMGTAAEHLPYLVERGANVGYICSLGCTAL